MEIQPAEDDPRQSPASGRDHAAFNTSQTGPSLQIRNAPGTDNGSNFEAAQWPDHADVGYGSADQQSDLQSSRQGRQQEPQQQQQQQEGVHTVDADLMPREAARTHCRQMYRAGFAALPLLWAVNVLMYWPHFRHGRDPEIARLTRRSAVGAALWLTTLAPWLLIFSIGQDALFGRKLFERLNVTGIDMAKWGLEF